VPGQPDGAAKGGIPVLRPLAGILTFEDEDLRFPKMDETWRAFGTDMAGQVSEALDGGRSPSERAYGVGVIVHNYFRTRGITLTSYELRALAGELVEPQLLAPPPPVPLPPPPPVVEKPEVKTAPVAELVSFTAKEEEATQRAWAGEETTPPPPAIAETAFVAPPSKLVNVVDREAASFDRVLMKVVEIAGPSIGSAPLDRALARATIDRAIDDVLRDEDAALPAEMRRRLMPMAFSEICGLGLLDRLWADRSIRAVYVDAPDQVHVDRNGVRMPAPETFRNAAHLLEIARRLARPASAGVVDVQLRDGGTGLVIFPPAAPAGPVLMLHRGEPGTATFDRLVASRLLDRRIAALLGIAARAHLNIVVTGPQGSGKTALLAAITRDLSSFRVVTLATHRQFSWPSAAKVELVAPANGPSFGTLMTAAARLRPDTLVIDSPPVGDIPALAGRLSRGGRGTVVALGTEALAAVLARAADIVVRLGQSPDGLFRVLAVEDATGAAIFVHDGDGYHRRVAAPAFAGMVKEAGYGEALAGLFR
jgi:type IV secretory pathway ATPase VirB11/archaellum biosynthesis ATPase